jgi:hypothetical protein
MWKVTVILFFNIFSGFSLTTLIAFLYNREFGKRGFRSKQISWCKHGNLSFCFALCSLQLCCPVSPSRMAAATTNKQVSSAHIHNDIALSILSKLPHKSRTRFTCVQKPRSFLFQSSFFMNMFTIVSYPNMMRTTTMTRISS